MFQRGGSAHKRGLSSEQVCVPCAIDRKGHSYGKIASLGKIATKNLHAVFMEKSALNLLFVPIK